MPEVWQENGKTYRRFTLRFGDCTEAGRASVYTIMKLLSELAGEDYELKGLGHRVLWENGQAFLLSRMAMSFERMPEYAQTFVAVTWERQKKGVFFYRDFEIRTEAGETIASATSLWFIVNPQTREVLRPADIYGGLREGLDERADCPECRRIAADESLPLLGQRVIYYSDLDANGHVNNAQYGRIAQDFLPAGYREKQIAQLFMEFKTETALGDTLIIKGAPSDEGFAIQGGEDGKLHFGARFVFA